MKQSNAVVKLAFGKSLLNYNLYYLTLMALLVVPITVVNADPAAPSGISSGSPACLIDAPKMPTGTDKFWCNTGSSLASGSSFLPTQPPSISVDFGEVSLGHSPVRGNPFQSTSVASPPGSGVIKFPPVGGGGPTVGGGVPRP